METKPVNDLWRLDCCALMKAYSDGLSPVDVVRECTLRIERMNPALNAIVHLGNSEAEARDSAERLRTGAARGDLEGVPIVIKDSLAVEGMPASWGSQLYAGQYRQRDELPVARLRSAGAIVLGKTNTPEFAVDGYTANDVFGVTRNPWDPHLTPGGSSGGSVSAVASGMVPAAIGTDGGGSIRRPASYTGLVGLKPTIGRIPRAGGMPQLLLDFEVVGPLTRTVRDAALLYDALSGPDRQDPRSRLIPVHEPQRSRLRILYVETFGDAPCDPAIRHSVAAAAHCLADLGHLVDSGPLPFDLEEFNAFWPHIAAVGLARLRRANPDFSQAAGAKYIDMADRGDSLSAAEFQLGVELIENLRRKVSLAFEHVDIIMTPACAAMPWPADEAFPDMIDGQAVGPRGHAVYTGWVNATGHPAIALPSNPAPGGLPIGFQLIGDLGSEPLLFDAARAFEAARPWAGRWPTIARLPSGGGE